MSAEKKNLAAQAIWETCDDIRTMLLGKNAAYGNSVFEPVRIFSKADPKEQIRVRLDDKISRLSRGQAAGEDVYLDLIGYLIIERAYDRYRKLVHGETQDVITGNPEIPQHKEEAHLENCDCWQCRSFHSAGAREDKQLGHRSQV